MIAIMVFRQLAAQAGDHRYVGCCVVHKQLAWWTSSLQVTSSEEAHTTPTHSLAPPPACLLHLVCQCPRSLAALERPQRHQISAGGQHLDWVVSLARTTTSSPGGCCQEGWWQSRRIG